MGTQCLALGHPPRARVDTLDTPEHPFHETRHPPRPAGTVPMMQPLSLICLRWGRTLVCIYLRIGIQIQPSNVAASWYSFDSHLQTSPSLYFFAT